MGSVIKSVAKTTLSFFKTVKDVICDAFTAVATVIINGVKTVVQYFKKILEYCWNGIKIIGKLLYAAGQELIHILTNKLGIPYLIQYFRELINKGVKILNENNVQIDPQNSLTILASKMRQNDQIMIKQKIIRNDTQEDEEQSENDFKQNDELDGIVQQTDSVAIVGNKEIKLDNLSRSNTNFSNYSNYNRFSNYNFRNYGY